MRTKLLGIGLALLAGGTARAQPGVTPPYPPTPPGGAVRPPGGAYAPPPGGVAPAGYNALPSAPTAPPSAELLMRTAMDPNHPWAIKPEHGPYFILVKSYVRPAPNSAAARTDPGASALELAQALAQEIRQTYQVQAFLFEHISEERKAEMRQLAAARQKAQAYQAELARLRQRAELQGMEFLEPDNKLHVLMHSHKDQIGVLVGGFQSEDDAKKALVKLKTWPTPKNELLSDKSAIVQTGADGKSQIVTAAINPYASAFVVPNPSVARAAATGPRGLDPFIVKLNEDNPYNLLKAGKGWTLAVKSFTSPVEITNKETTPSVMQKVGFGGDSKGAKALRAAGEQAEELAKALRSMTGPAGPDGRAQSLNLETFVLHTRSASIVTVGQFDGPDDPALHATKRLLAGLQTRVSEDKTGARPVMNAPSLFGELTAMPVPKP